MAAIKHPFKVFPKTPTVFPNFEGSKEDVYAWLSGDERPYSFFVYCVANETYQEAREFLDENRPFVPKYYKMNPKTDDLLPNGRHLANGMVVLIENPNRRVDVSDELSDWEEDRASENNRWCTVGALEVDDRVVRFIGVYEDGSKRMRTFQVGNAWYVKKDSVRDPKDLASSIHDLVKSALEEYETENYSPSGETTYGGITSEAVAEDTTKKILGLL